MFFENLGKRMIEKTMPELASVSKDVPETPSAVDIQPKNPLVNEDKSFFSDVGKRLEERVKILTTTAKKKMESMGTATYEAPKEQGPAYTGSTRANRNNNPLNIKFSPYTAKYDGVIGLDESEADDGGQFIKFRSVEDGFNAAKKLLSTENYVGLTVDQALKRWSNNGYNGEIIPRLKNKIMGQLTEQEKMSLVITMANHEGFEFNRQGGPNQNSKQQGTPKLSGLGTITTMPGTSTKYEKVHPGIDIANKSGTPIKSFTNGIVVAVENGKKQGEKGFGNYVIVVDKDGNKHRYSHMNQGFVKVGQQVGQGQTLGSMGATGSTYSDSGGDASHLDYRVVSAFGKYQNPLTYMKNYLS